MSDEDAAKRRASPLAQPGYRRLWAARTVSQWGDVIQFTTVALLALRLTGSGAGVSGAVLAEVVPLIALAPLAGPLVDRLPRVKVMVGADVVRVVLAAVLAVFHGQIAVVYAVAFGLSAGSAFFNPAAGSLLPSLVGDDQLVAANSGIWSAAVLSQVIERTGSEQSITLRAVARDRHRRPVHRPPLRRPRRDRRRRGRLRGRSAHRRPP
ncbi:MAG: MFS transporter [Acidimicrobiales bacterium]